MIVPISTQRIKSSSPPKKRWRGRKLSLITISLLAALFSSLYFASSSPSKKAKPEQSRAPQSHFKTLSFMPKKDISLTEASLKTGRSISTLLSFNSPSQQTLPAGKPILYSDKDGLLIHLKKTQPISAISEAWGVSPAEIREANGLTGRKDASGDIFVPGVLLSPKMLESFFGQELLLPWPDATVAYPFASQVILSAGLSVHFDGEVWSRRLQAKVLSALSGRIEDTGFTQQIGRYVTISSKGMYRITYGMLGKVLVSTGQSVLIGDPIGTSSAQSGGDKASRLYLAITKNGEPLQPSKVFKLQSPAS